MNLLFRILLLPFFLALMAVWLSGTLIAATIGYLDLTNIRLPKHKRFFKFNFYPEHIKGVSDKIAFHEYIWNIGAGKIGSIMGVINNIGWGTMLLAVFHLDKFFWLVPIAVIAYPVIIYSVGYLLHVIKYIYRQGDVNNRLMNPQLVRTEKKVEQVLEKIIEKLG